MFRKRLLGIITNVEKFVRDYEVPATLVNTSASVSKFVDSVPRALRYYIPLMPRPYTIVTNKEINDITANLCKRDISRSDIADIATALTEFNTKTKSADIKVRMHPVVLTGKRFDMEATTEYGDPFIHMFAGGSLRYTMYLCAYFGDMTPSIFIFMGMPLAMSTALLAMRENENQLHSLVMKINDIFNRSAMKRKVRKIIDDARTETPVSSTIDDDDPNCIFPSNTYSDGKERKKSLQR